VIAPACKHECVKRFGKNRNGSQRFRCGLCGATWTEDRPQPIGNMRIDEAKAVQVLEMLLEGVSIRSTSRITGIAKGTILSLLEVVGERALRFWGSRMRGIHVNDVQVDEIWGFVGMKEKTCAKQGAPAEFGDAYCFTGIERDSKLLVSWHLGKRSKADTLVFADKLAYATVGRFQLTTDGFAQYPAAITGAMGNCVDFAQLVKIYGAPRDGMARYSPAEIIDIRKNVICGTPDKAKICTSHVERHNLSIRMGIRRMTRLTNAFSKKWANHEYALAMFFLYYNYCKPHGTLSKSKQWGQRGTPTTPAMAAGLTDHVFTLAELLGEMATHY
jgi:transposase-like protein/IS1 family transposase